MKGWTRTSHSASDCGSILFMKESVLNSFLQFPPAKECSRYQVCNLSNFHKLLFHCPAVCSLQIIFQMPINKTWNVHHGRLFTWWSTLTVYFSSQIASYVLSFLWKTNIKCKEHSKNWANLLDPTSFWYYHPQWRVSLIKSNFSISLQ